MPHVDRFVSVTEAKNRFLDLIRGLKSRQEIVAITREGVPAAVLLSIDQFEGLMETIEILSDRQAMRSLRRSLKQAESGEWVSHEAVFGRDRVCEDLSGLYTPDASARIRKLHPQINGSPQIPADFNRQS
jgi:antitoxin YefM